MLRWAGQADGCRWDPREDPGSTLLLSGDTRQGQAAAPGPVAFRSGETEAQSYLSSLSSRWQRHPRSMGTAPPRGPLARGPMGGLCAQVCPHHGSGAWEGAGWQPCFHGARLSGAQGAGSFHRGAPSLLSLGPSQASSECQV